MTLIKTQFTEAEKHRRMKPLKGDNWSCGMRLMLGGGKSIARTHRNTPIFDFSVKDRQTY